MRPQETYIEALLTEKTVARLLNLSTSSLRRRRAAGLSPAWVKASGSVRYHPDAIRRFIAEGEARSLAQPALGIADKDLG